jgi:hypothetical protein
MKELNNYIEYLKQYAPRLAIAICLAAAAATTFACKSERINYVQTQTTDSTLSKKQTIDSTIKDTASKQMSLDSMKKALEYIMKKYNYNEGK